MPPMEQGHDRVLVEVADDDQHLVVVGDLHEHAVAPMFHGRLLNHRRPD